MKVRVRDILTTLIVSIVGGILGRLGGWEKGDRLYRMLGVPFCCVLLMLVLYHPLNWWYYGALFLTYGAVLEIGRAHV